MFRSHGGFPPSIWSSDLLEEDEEQYMLDPYGYGDQATTLLFILPATQRQAPTTPQQQQQEQRELARDTMTMPQTDESRMAMEEEEDDDEDKQALLDADFFEDLPFGARDFDSTMPPTLSPPTHAKTKQGYAYNTYSYSACVTLDDKGRAVESARRRYDDSAGVLKAVHRRQIGTHVMESTWFKRGTEDEGQHSKAVNTGDTIEFEREWMDTPFGAAEKRAREHGEAKQTELPDAPLPQEIP